LAVLVVLVNPAASVATGRPLFPHRAVLAKVDWATGLTTQYIAVAHPIQTGQRQIGLGVALAAIRLPNAKAVPGNRFPDRAEISPAGLPRVVQATLGGIPGWAAAQEALVARIASVAPELARAVAIA
jgi:hypothetical protein